MNLSRDGDLYRFSLPLDPKKYGGKVAEQDPRNQQAFMTLMSFEISVTFPGRVLDTNGTINGRSVSWKVVANQPKPAELRAVAEAPAQPSASVTPAAAADAGGGFPWLLVVGGVVVLLLVAVVVVLLLRRPRGPAAAAPAAPTPAPTPPADRPA
ncbi:LppM family (lipo)protein [Micromonospora chersina]|uniref:LppM family (lipo)protein n=1 Tax=Micromonospora chersina TaxID=47854 RepID=UPI003F4D23A7